MEGCATFLIGGEVGITVKFDCDGDTTREDMQDEAWSALISYLHRNHEVVYSFERAKTAESAPPPTETDSEEVSHKQ